MENVVFIGMEMTIGEDQNMEIGLKNSMNSTMEAVVEIQVMTMNGPV